MLLLLTVLRAVLHRGTLTTTCGLTMSWGLSSVVTAPDRGLCNRRHHRGPRSSQEAALVRDCNAATRTWHGKQTAKQAYHSVANKLTLRSLWQTRSRWPVRGCASQPCLWQWATHRQGREGFPAAWQGAPSWPMLDQGPRILAFAIPTHRCSPFVTIFSSVINHILVTPFFHIQSHSAHL